MSLENEMLIQRLFPESQMEKYIRPVAKKYLDRVSSGEQLVLKNTVGDMPLNSLSIYGKSTQNTTSGVQLYDVNKAERNANVSVDDNGWITVRYDNTEREDAWYISADVNVSELIQTSKTYTFVCEIKTLVGGQLNAVTKYVDARAGQFETEARYNSTGTFAKQIIAKDNFDDCATMLRTVFTVNPSENGECAFRISVLDDATITADTFIYEPFTGGIPSPNPDYPQKIVSIGDDGGGGCRCVWGEFA